MAEKTYADLLKENFKLKDDIARYRATICRMFALLTGEQILSLDPMHLKAVAWTIAPETMETGGEHDL